MSRRRLRGTKETTGKTGVIVERAWVWGIGIRIRVVRRRRRGVTHPYSVRAHRPLLIGNRWRGLVPHEIDVHKSTGSRKRIGAIKGDGIRIRVGMERRGGVGEVMQRGRRGIFVLGIGVEVKVGARALRVVVVVKNSGRFIVGRISGGLGVGFTVRRGIENGRRRSSRGVIVIVIVIVVEMETEEVVERETNRLKGVNISDVRLGEGVALVDGFVEKGATLPTEGDRRQVIELGAGATHSNN